MLKEFRRTPVFGRIVIALLGAAISATGLALSGGPVAQAAQDSAPGPAGMLPSPVPSSSTPAVDDGGVYAIAQVGDTMVIGGTFTSVDGRSRSRLAAFNRTTGALTAFAPRLNSYVNQVIPGSNSHTVYVAGDFTTVNGDPAKFVTELDLGTGQRVSSFRSPSFDLGEAKDLVLRGQRLYVAGTFSVVDGQSHGGLVALDAGSGDVDSFVNLQFTGHHNDSGVGAQGSVGASDLDVTADGRTMVIVGNFKHVDGLLRDQLAVVDLSGSKAEVSRTWATGAYEPLGSHQFDYYVRGVSLSPNGSYFVVTATGGVHPGTLCDAAARFELRTSSTNVKPTWVDESGGDSLWGVTVTGSAVFVGGHNRWMNNPAGANTPRAGAVPRPGLQALDPATGRPLSWNPGRVPLGVAAFAFLATDDGVWVGSDTDYIGNYEYRRPKLAFFPYAGGKKIASTTTGRLANTVFLASNMARTNQLRSVRFNGISTLPYAKLATNGIDFTKWRGAFMVGTSVYYGYTNGYLYSRQFDGRTFGPAVKVDPYHDPAWAGVKTGVHDTPTGEYFDGALPTFYGQLAKVTGMAYANGRLYYTLLGNSHLYSRWFLPDSAIMDQTVVTVPSSVSFRNAEGMFIAGGKLYFGSSIDGSLHAVSFVRGAVAGAPREVIGQARRVGSMMRWRNTAMFLSSGPRINWPPTARFSVTCKSLTCTVDASRSGDSDGFIVKYAWSFSAFGKTAKWTFVHAGTHQIRLTVTDNSGATSSVTHTVDVTR